MNPQSNYDLQEQKRLELLQHSRETHYHNLLLGYRPKPMQFVSQIRNNIRSISKLRHLRVRVQLEVAEPCPEGANC